MNTDEILKQHAINFEKKLTKSPAIKLTVREAAQMYGVGVNVMHRYFWAWKELGFMTYVAKNAEQGDWYWNGVKDE